MPGKFKMTEAKVRRWVDEGRGRGLGAAYRPWITIHDLSSKGRVSRMWSVTAARQHHFLSDLEYAFGLVCDWDPHVVDMREQFPLDRADTLAIASDIGVRHPCIGDCFPVMTSDMLLDIVVDGRPSQLAVAIKYVADIEDAKGGPRVIEKLEIERRYWRRRGVAWFIMTEREIEKRGAETFRRLIQHRDFDGLRPPAHGSWEERAATVERELTSGGSGTVANFCLAIDRAQGWSDGDSLAMVWHLAATRRVAFDIDVGLDPRGPLSQLALIARPALSSRAA